MVNQRFKGGAIIPWRRLISLLRPFICGYSTNIKPFAEKLAEV
jgi:hypothetical protein